MNLPSLQQLAEAMRHAEHVTVTFTAEEALALIGHVQLACRHPGNLGPSRRAAEAGARRLGAALAAEVPEAERLIEMGWHPVFDVPREGGGR